MRQARFIPTHVGNSGRDVPRPYAEQLHPHARGEQVENIRKTHGSNGSSPRTWGTGQCVPLATAIGRFIPTHVGNSWCAGWRPDPAAVHPHARGEQMPLGRPLVWVTGSSPRTWGTDMAGVNPVRQRAVHPHARGEQCSTGNALGSSIGSSPRTWGTGAHPSRCMPLTTVHPHARGEQAKFGHWQLAPGGSSPRTWGTVVGSVTLPMVLFGSSPRTWGTGSRISARTISRPVHPHARGEQGRWLICFCLQPGSSPRTWGTGLCG